MPPVDPTNTDSELFPDLLPEEPPSPPRKPRTRKPKAPQHPSESPAPETPAPAPTLAPDPFWAKVDALWAKHGMPLRPKVIMRTDPQTGKTVFTNTDLVPELAPQQEEANWATPASSVPSVTQPPEESTAKTPICDTSASSCGTTKTPPTPVFSDDQPVLTSSRPHKALSVQGVTQPPDHSSAKPANCGTSSLFCGTPELQRTPVFSGDDAGSCEARPHKADFLETTTAKDTVCGAIPDFCGTTETPATETTASSDGPSTSVRPHDTFSPEELAAKSANGSAMEIRDDDPPEVRLKKRALKIFQNGGSYKTVAGNLGISRDKARTWKRLWEIGRFEDNIRGIRFSGDYSDEIKAKVRERLRAGATPGELEKEFKIPRQTIRKWQ